MIEPEIAFCDLTQNMDCVEGYLRHCFSHVLAECGEDLAFLEDYEVKRKEEAGEGRSGTRTLVPQLALAGALSVRRRGAGTSDSLFVGRRAA